MKTWSFIDFGNKDFLRNDNDEVIRIQADSQEAAEDWLLNNHNNTDWTNSGTRFWCWEEQE